jgi:hypothetical protein
MAQIPFLVSGTVMPPSITIEPIPKTGDREDFSVRVADSHHDYQFRLSITGFILAIWRVDPYFAAEVLTDRVVYSHGTADGFPVEGYWFDSYNSSETLEETSQDIITKSARHFVHPSIRSVLGKQLQSLLDELDEISTARRGQAFVRSLEMLVERSQATDDFESEARDQANFIYRVCMLAAIIDRFNFGSSQGSLDGLRSWLAESYVSDTVDDLTRAFFNVRKLRRQYPIHETYEETADGIRARRRILLDAEAYFGIRGEPAHDWNAVRTKFMEQLAYLRDTLKGRTL